MLFWSKMLNNSLLYFAENDSKSEENKVKLVTF
jgi:hypothetical protein